MNKTAGGCQVGNLIDLSTDADSTGIAETAGRGDNAEVLLLGDQGSKSKPAAEKSQGRLSGYLNKQNSRGLLRTFRKRWFVLSPDSCVLYYYKTPHDQQPLGEIDISKASFNFDVTNRSKGVLFTISVPGKEYTLEAANHQVCLYWLQELQKFRRASSLHRTEQIQGKSEFKSNLIGLPKSGLLGNVVSAPKLKDDPDLRIPVDYPADMNDDVEGTAVTNPLAVAQQKLSNFKTQVLGSRQNKSLNDLSSQASMEQKNPNSSNSIFFDVSPASSTKDLDCPPSPGKSRNPSFSAFRMKITESFRKARSSDEEEQNPSAFRLSWRNSCAKCQLGEEKIESLMDEVSSFQDEVTVSRTLIKDLQQQLDIVLKEKEVISVPDQVLKTQTVMSNNCSDNVHVEQQKQLDYLQDLVMSLKKEVLDLQKQNEVLREMLQRKDNTIVSLTNEVFDLEAEIHSSEAKRKASQTLTSIEEKPAENMQQELEDLDYLRDAVRAFELQNKFLNKEVLELNQLRDESEQREQALIMKCSEWEARCCQIQSKLLFLLNELNKPDKDGRNRELIGRLLEEAMADGDSSLSLPKWSFEESYDDLGFNWKWGKDDLLSTKAQNLKQRSEEIANKAKDDLEITSWRVKWDNFVVSFGDKELQRTPELKALLRMGIPREHKGRIWKGCVDLAIKYDKQILGPNYYNRLLSSEEYVSKIDPSSKQIELDLLRTLPNNRHYENLESDGIPKLRRVLLAYSRHNPIVGYCQGLNRLAAIALLFMNEEDAFWCLVAIIRYLMPEGYYCRTLIAAQVDQRVLKDLMFDKIPRLHAHLEAYNIDLSLFTFNWFLTVFVDNIPVETYLRIWDVFLFEGSKVLFRYALAFFKYCENDILQLKDYIAISRFLRSMAESMTDIKKLNQIAFGELNPFPQRVIDSKRAQHMAVVKAQLDEFESARNSLPKQAPAEASLELPADQD